MGERAYCYDSTMHTMGQVKIGSAGYEIIPRVISLSKCAELAVTPVQVIHCEAGDIFAMRPLLLHGSLASRSGTTMHRRVIHIQIASSACLPLPYHWHPFDRIDQGF